MGRMTRDPELRRTNSGNAVASFCIAVDRDYGGKDGGEKETDFIDCVAFRQTGEFVSKYFSKGRMIVVSGRLQIRNWTDNEGKKRRSAEVIAENCYFGDSKSSQDGGNQQQSGFQGQVMNQQFAPQQGFQQPQNGFQNPQGYQPQNFPQYNQQGFGGYQQQGYPAQGFQPPQGNYGVITDDDAQLPF
jgi:single-strand DNA-binding protein